MRMNNPYVLIFLKSLLVVSCDIMKEEYSMKDIKEYVEFLNNLTFDDYEEE